MKNYKPLKYGNCYTIGQYDDDYKAIIINDGIYGWYTWENVEAAQNAADAYNNFMGNEWLKNKRYGTVETITDANIDDYDLDTVSLYGAFGLVDLEEGKK